MSRVLIVSNRLPITTEVTDEAITFTSAAGGLATGLRGTHERGGGLWIGWPGIPAPIPEPQREQLARELLERGIVPVHLTADELRDYYEDFSNGVIWPLFHYLLDRLPLGPDVLGHLRQRQPALRRRNRRALSAGRPDLGARLPADAGAGDAPAAAARRARIGFFLHIPFPAVGSLPDPAVAAPDPAGAARRRPDRLPHLLLRAALLGGRRRSARASIRTTAACGSTSGAVRFGVFPMGVDAEYFRQLATSPEVVAAAAAELSAQAAGRTIVLGVDRLDYTKGIPRRLLAFEALLRDDPELRDRVRLVQVAVPSREAVVELPGFPQGSRRADRPHQRAVRHAVRGADSLPVSIGRRRSSWSRCTAPPT